LARAYIYYMIGGEVSTHRRPCAEET